MKLLVFAGSLRRDSYNKKYAKNALKIAEEFGAECEFIDLLDYAMPCYDGDIEESSGLPQNTQKLSAKIAQSDGMIISTPEYNAGIPGVLKNIVDWVSRDKQLFPFTGKHLLLISTSPGALGGVRGLWHSRQPFEALGVHVYPTMLGLPNYSQAFDGEGNLIDESNSKQLRLLIEKFVGCMK